MRGLLRHGRHHRAGVALAMLLAPQQPTTELDLAAFASAIERRTAAGELSAARAELQGAMAALRTAAQQPRHSADILRVANCALMAGAATLAHELATATTAALVAARAAPTTILGARTLAAAATLARVDFAAARSELEPLVADLTTAHGEHHPHTAVAKVLLSRTWRRLGDAPRSLALAAVAADDLAAALPADAPAVLTAQINLGEARLDTGDVAGAEELLAPACAALAAAGPDHGLELNITRGILGRIQSRRGQRAEALALHQRALAALTAAMPADHVYRLLGQLSVAFALPAGTADRLSLAESALAGLLRTLGDQHFYTQNARLAVGANLLLAGHAAAARPHAAAAAEILTRDYPQHRLSLNARALLADAAEALDRNHESHAVRTELLTAFLARFPSGHVETQLARIALAETERRRGDLHGATARLETALQIHATDSPDHAELRARILDRLAAARADQGDLPAALRLREAILATFERTDADPIERLLAEQDVAALRATFDPTRAVELQQRVVAAIEADADLMAELPRALGNLGALHGEAGDNEQARRLAERVLALPPTVTGPSRAFATNNLAEALARSGELRTAAQLHHAAAELFGAAAPVDAAVARSNAAWALAQLGDDTALAAADAALATLARLGARDDLAFVDCLRRAALVAARTGDRAAADPRLRGWADALRERLLRWTFAPRELALWVVRHEAVAGVLAARANNGDATFAADYLLTTEAMRGFELRAARWARRALAPAARRTLAALTDDVAAAAVAVANAPADQLPNAVEARDRSQRALLAELQRHGGDASTVRPQDFVRGLPPHTSVATVRSITTTATNPGAAAARELIGAVVTGDGVVQIVALGNAADTEVMVDELLRRGQLARARITLRERVLDPLLARLPVDTTALYLAVDDVLQLVPWDALEHRTGDLVGERLAIRPLTSLFELLDTAPPASDLPAQLLACGGIDYGAADGDAANVRTAADRMFHPLPASSDEVTAIAARFTIAAGASAPVVLTGRAADKAGVATAATAATHIHLATHGYLAPELTDATAGDRVRLAPQVLCGLALAGANDRGPALASQPGIVTAEELAAWPLDRCELVVLSACEGARGAAIRGQSLASLRTALRTAGARHVVASSWRVSDHATRQLMADFYEHLLAEPPPRRDPQRALWLARLRARDRGAEYRDWAGWTVTGR